MKTTINNQLERIEMLKSVIDFDDFFNVELTQWAIVLVGNNSPEKKAKYCAIEGGKVSHDKDATRINFDGELTISLMGNAFPTKTITLDGASLEVEYRHNPESGDNITEPLYKEFNEIMAVKIGGQNVFELLSESKVYEIEKAINE